MSLGIWWQWQVAVGFAVKHSWLKNENNAMQCYQRMNLLSNMQTNATDAPKGFGGVTF